MCEVCEAKACGGTICEVCEGVLTQCVGRVGLHGNLVSF